MVPKHHPTSLPGCTLRPEEIGQALARLRFDVMLQILRAFMLELRSQALADHERKRFQLARSLFDAVDRMSPLTRCLNRAWRISRPYMEDEMADPNKKS